jgi:hypothetical protein
MKKGLLISALLLVFFLTSGTGSAHRIFFGFGFFPPVIVSPPVIVVAPPPAYYPYPPYSYDYYRHGYYGYPVWVPGYWDTLWAGRGWERVWIPGHWEYRP